MGGNDGGTGLVGVGCRFNGGEIAALSLIRTRRRLGRSRWRRYKAITPADPRRCICFAAKAL